MEMEEGLYILYNGRKKERKGKHWDYYYYYSRTLKEAEDWT